MPFLNNVDQIRSIDWSQRYLWDIRFPTVGSYQGAPTPFDSWFPAVEVTENIANLESHAFEAFLRGYRIPKRGTSKDLKVTFLDGADPANPQSGDVLIRWLQDWIENIILNNYQSISTLESSVKLIQLLKLNRSRQEVSRSQYWVYPEGSLHFEGTSNSELQSYSVNFVIVGRG